MALNTNANPTAVLGAGFAGLAAACELARLGRRVIVFEKNDGPGGRARQFTQDGYTFDMGPSWYWMPDVFERFFQRFGKQVSDYYTLERLDPGYRIEAQDGQGYDIPADSQALRDFFEQLEPGSAAKLDRFMREAAYKYEVGVGELVYKPGRSLLEFADRRFLSGLLRLQVFTSVAREVRGHFQHPVLRQLLEFPVLFLGAPATRIPALYTLMNWADLQLGTWYPKGGMYRIVDGLYQLALELGVEFRFGEPVESIETAGREAQAVLTVGGRTPISGVVAAADYHHVEQALLPQNQRNYSPGYWNNRVLAPSSLLFYLGLDTPLPELLHHTLFFDTPFETHAQAIYDQPAWPDEPLFYANRPTASDPQLAPAGHETLFLLIPLAPGLHDPESVREQYYHKLMDRLQAKLGRDLRPHVQFKRSYAQTDFIQDYNALQGNAYGLANTLLQTAILKPAMANKRVRNLFYAGQLTVPGPGVPPSLISGQLAANELHKTLDPRSASTPVTA